MHRFLPRASAAALALGLALAGPLAAGPLADARVAFAYGLKALLIGDLPTAVREFEEAVSLDPEDGTAHYYLGLALLRSEEEDRAAAAFERALAAAEPPRVGSERVEEDLALAAERAARSEAEGGAGESLAEALPPMTRLEQGDEYRPFSGRAAVGVESDSNPLLLADWAVYNPPDQSPVRKSTDTIPGADLRLAWTPGRGDGAGPLSLAFTGSAGRYQDLSFLDYENGRAVVSFSPKGSAAGYALGPLGFARTPEGAGGPFVVFQAGAGQTRVDGETAFEVREAGALVGLERGKGSTELTLTYRDLDFSDDRDDAFRRSGDELLLGLAQTFYLGRRDRFVRLAAGAGQRDSGAALDADSREVSGTFYYGFNGQVSLALSGGLRQDDFSELESDPVDFELGGDPREDTTTWVSGALSFQLTRRLLLGLQGGFQKRDSEISGVDLDYDRITARAVVTWLF